MSIKVLDELMVLLESVEKLLGLVAPEHAKTVSDKLDVLQSKAAGVAEVATAAVPVAVEAAAIVEPASVPEVKLAVEAAEVVAPAVETEIKTIQNVTPVVPASALEVKPEV